MNMPNTLTPSLLLTGAIAIALVGCASAPRQNLQLDEARAAVTAAHNDPQVAGDALVELTTADGALASADALSRANRPVADVDHEAFVADRFAHAAQQHGQLIAATAAIAAVESRRNAVLIAAREDEAGRANVRAERKTLEASVARDQAADSARETASETERADRLDAQLADLKAKQTDRGVVVTLGDVLFATGRSDLQEGSQHSLAGLTAFLSAHPERTVRVEGFTDNVGTEDYNRGLSDRRASSVADALMRGGIVSARIRTEGYGTSYPVARNDSALGRQQNRRVEVVISDGDQQVVNRDR